MENNNNKIAEFDLELAKQGHPLCTRNGKKVIEFVYFSKNYRKDLFPLVCIIKENPKRIRSFQKSGKHLGNCQSEFDLFLDKSIPWEKPLKEGEIIEVFTSSGWQRKVLVHLDKSGWIIAASRNIQNRISLPLYQKDHWRRISEKTEKKVTNE
jgi:hypothetical protein